MTPGSVMTPTAPAENPLLTAINLQQQGRLEEAEALFRRILSVAPENGTALYSLAVILLQTGRSTEALASAQVGTAANPAFAQLWFIQGVALQAFHRRDEALAAFDRAIALDPKYTEAMVNSGVLLHDMHRQKDALLRFQQVLEVDPSHENALGNSGILLTEFKLGPEAVATFERLLQVNPDYPYALGLLLYERMHHCDWTDLEPLTQRITEGIREGKRTCKTLAYMALSDSAEDHYRCARIFADRFAPSPAHPAPQPLWTGQRYGHARKRIAYISPDLREHPVGHLMAGVIETHDKTRFETIGIHLGIDDGSRLRARFIAAFDHFIDAKDLSARQIAELLRKLEVDIAIDLAGYTTDSRTEIFSHRPAPIQVNYLGYPGTLGLDCIDYILADRTVIPESHRAFYTERPAYLEHCYLPLPSGLEVAAPKRRKDYGLPERGFVFCAFSHDYKVHPRLFEIWMRLLAANPGSVLWLVSRNELSQENLRKAAEAHGVEPDRLVFAGRTPLVEDHLARYRVADLFLDTWPYNAHTTAADALLAGLPVLTYQGEAFPSRVASSLLQTLGLPDLVTHSLEDYFATAHDLAQHPRKLQKFRKRLKPETLQDHPFLGASFTRALERTLDALEPVLPCRDEAHVEPTPAQDPVATDDPDLAQAWDLFRQANLPQAEILARHVSERGLTEAVAPLLDAIREGYGIPRGFELSEHVRPSGVTGPRYLLIKAWGYGFWSEGHHLAIQLLLAELTHRTPIVLWGSNCLFRAEGDVDASGRFFADLPAARMEDIPADATFFPPKWRLDNLREENLNKWDGEGSRITAQQLFARPETVVVSDFYTTLSAILPWIGTTSRYHGRGEDALYAELFRTFLKPTATIEARAEAFFQAQMQGRPWVGVHVRGSDKVLESPRLARTNGGYFDFVDRIVALNPTIGIFLLTDASPQVEAFQQRYGDRVLCTQAVRTHTTVGVHLSGQDGPAIGEEVFVDTLLATRCNYFVGNRESNVSLAVASLKDWPKGFLFLLGEKDIRGENLFLHHRGAPVMPPKAVEAVPHCRLCGGEVEAQFQRTVLGRHEVTYHRCQTCQSLQTDTPHWLDEAYGQDPERFDTGKASRTLANTLMLPRLLEILGVQKHHRSADFGGGTGLFARLMRDQGWNFFSFDKYGSGEFAAGFRWHTFDRPVKLVTVFECAEHFADPAKEWAALFSTDPDVVLGSTGLYVGQGSDWVYLTPESGQHVFFYSPEGLAQLAARHGRHAYILGGYFLMSRQPLSQEAGAALVAWHGSLGEVAGTAFRSWMQQPFEAATRDNQHVTLLARLQAAGVHFALDGTFFRFATGISRLWKSLLAEWSANGFGAFITVLDRGRTAPRFPGIRYLDLPPQINPDRAADRQMLQAICDLKGITHFTSTYYTVPLTTPAALLVPDMIPEVMGSSMGFDLQDAQWLEKHEAIRYAQRFLSISHSTTQDLLRFFPEVPADHVTTAHCGTDFIRPSQEQVQAFRTRHGIDRPYFLISGVKSGYKNALLFFQAFERLGDRRKDFAIVCTNSRPVLEPEFQGYSGEAPLHLLVLSDADLQCAYAGAQALVYPSRYEGFGLPVLEAMTCGCPVITCRTSSIPEVAGEAALYVDPDHVEGMKEALLAMQDEARRDDLIARGLQQAQHFSWRSMADTVQNALSSWAIAIH